MKRALFLLTLLVATTAIATQPVMMDEQSFYTNAEQYVTAALDGEGEAFVSTKIRLTNQGNDSIQELHLSHLPGDADIVAISQEIQQRTCRHWDRRCIQRSDEGTCTEYNWQGRCIESNDCVQYKRTCQRYVKTGQPRYEALSYTKNDESIDVELNKAIRVGQRSTVYLFYDTDQFTDEGLFGKWSYEIRSLGLPYRSEQLRLQATTPERFTMSEGDSGVEYEAENVATSLRSDVQSGQARDVQKTLSRIHDHDGHVETFSNMDAGETATLAGAYATSWFRLNWWKLLLTLAIIGVVLTGIILLFREAISRIETDSPHPYLMAVLSSFVLAFLTVILWIGGIILIQFIHELVSYEGLFVFVFFLLLGLLTLVLHVATPVFVAKQENLLSGVLSAVFTILWLFAFFVLALLISAVLHQPDYIVG